MENPTSWGEAERVVHEAVTQWQKDHDAGMVGLSMVRVITDALRQAGLLKDG